MYLSGIFALLFCKKKKKSIVLKKDVEYYCVSDFDLFYFSFGKVHERYVTRLRKKLQFEERKQANQRRVVLLVLVWLFDFVDHEV